MKQNRAGRESLGKDVKSGRPRGTLRANLLLSLGTLLLCFLFLEIGLRVVYGNPPPFYYPQVRHVLTAYGYKPEPNQKGTWSTNQPVTTNSYGFRDVEWAVPKPPGVVRVMLLGDSLTFGNAAKASDRFSDVVRGMIRERHPEVEVINTSGGGWNLHNELLFLELEGFGYEPDVLVLCFFPNDWATPASSANPRAVLTSDGRYDGRPAWLRWLPYRTIFLLKRSAVVTFIRDRLAVAMQGDDFVSDLLQDRIDLAHDKRVVFTAQELSRLKTLCDNRGIRLVLAVIPPVNLFWLPRLTPEYVQLLGDLARRTGMAFVDLSERFWNVSDTTSLYLSPWDNHLSPKGHRLVAEQLLPVVEGVVRDLEVNGGTAEHGSANER